MNIKRVLLFVCCMMLSFIVLYPAHAAVSDSTELYEYVWPGGSDSTGYKDVLHPQNNLKDTLVFDFFWMSPHASDEQHYKTFAAEVGIEPFTSTNDSYLYINQNMVFDSENNSYTFEWAVPESYLHCNDLYVSDPDNENYIEHHFTSSYLLTDDSQSVGDLTRMTVSTYDSGRYNTSNSGADQPVPEPSTWAMMGTGIMGFIGLKYREWKYKKKK